MSGIEGKSTNKCTCGSALLIESEIRQGKWRIGFNLVCQNCKKKFTYTSGKLKES